MSSFNVNRLTLIFATLLLAIATHSCGNCQQQLSSRTAHQRARANGQQLLFQDDGGSLKDSKEILVHLKAKQTKEYYFHIQEEDTSIWLVVTPCGGFVKWKLAQQVDDSNDDETNGDVGSGGFGPTSNTEDRRSDIKTKQIFEHATRNDEEVETLNFLQPRKESTLVREVGKQAMEYVRDSMPAGNLHLYVTAADNDTTVRVFVTTDSKVDEYFPKLPRRKRLNLLNISTNSVTVSWDHSPSVNFYKQTDVQYCLVLSAVKYYATYCEINHDPRQLPLNEQNRKSNYMNKAASQNGQMAKPIVACTQYKTTYQFENLVPDTKYHLSLFTINTHTGGSAAYEGASFVTRVEKQYTDTVVVLKDGEMYASYLNPARASFRLYDYLVEHFYRQIVLTVQPCTGYIRVNLYKDGRILRKSVFEELKTFVVTNVKPGVLRVKVVNDDSDAKLYKIWASSRPSRNPYPRLPVDTSIKVLEHSRTCRSVTLAWLGSTEKHDYCLYRRKEEDDYFKQLILEESNQCQGPPAKMEKVFCRRFKVTNDSEVIMKASVAELKPSTTYRFDLYASKPNKQQLSYRTVWVKTKRDCTDAT